MAKRQIQFTQEQIEILLKNANVADATSNTIKFTPEFKKLALEKSHEGMSPNDIFKEAGFTMPKKAVSFCVMSPSGKPKYSELYYNSILSNEYEYTELFKIPTNYDVKKNLLYKKTSL